MVFGNFIFGSSGFSKYSLNIWKFTVHVLLKSGLENLIQITIISSSVGKNPLDEME